MSYLDATHLVFSGDFLSDVSTVNNDPAHYNNATFQPSFQEFGLGANNGWWNPEGGATFIFQNCTVKKVAMENGTEVSSHSHDSIIGTIVCGAEGRNTGKMVDLDPQEQGSSELWGVKLRITTSKNELLFEGNIKNTGFRDLQTRQQTGGKINGQPFGGTWTSVIEDVVWGEHAGASPFVAELKSKTHENKLSINLNAYGYYYAHAKDGRFSMGRILGAIGPWHAEEPKTFAACRRLYGIYVSGTGGGGLPLVFFSNTNFLYSHHHKCLTVDFGSSFPIADAMGSISFNDKIYLAVSKAPVNAGISATPLIADESNIAMIGQVNYKTGPNWLNDTGGIVTFSNLKSEVNELLKNNQLLLLRLSGSGQYTIIAREAINGTMVRADEFVNRLDYGQTNNINFYAYQWGNPLKDAVIQVSLQPATPATPKGKDNPICEIPGNNYPEDGISFHSTITTKDNGHQVLKLKGNRIDNPRGYIDGQIYTLDYQLSNNPQDPAMGPLANDNVFIHLRDYFEVPEKPEWSDIAPTMIQFGNLYPIMSKYFVNLGDPDAVIAKKDLLKFAFSRDLNDPIYMPVTRDLSEGKKQTILKWLNNPVVVTAKAEAAALTFTTSTVEADNINPAQAGAPLTDNQQRLKNAVRAKNGAGFTTFEIEKLFND